MRYTEEQIIEMLLAVYGGSVTPRRLPKALYFAIAEYLREGLYAGTEMSLAEAFDTRDYQLIEELRTNVYMFSAAKTHSEITQFGALLSKASTFKEFEKMCRPIFDQYNKDWLRTEYVTAKGQGQMAVRWSQIQADKKDLPILEYVAVIDANTSDICRPLDGLKAPVGHPIWRKITPLNHFNCRCTLIQHPYGHVTANPTKIVNEVTRDMDDAFLMNPGIDKYVFSPVHPYFQVAPKDRNFAKTNFGLPIPKSD